MEKLDKLDDQSSPTTEANAAVVDLQSPDRKLVPRRFVQSTLFPVKHNVQNCVKKEVKTIEVIDDDNNEDEDEVCGSQGRKRKRATKQPKRTPTPKKRPSRKVANGQSSPSIAVDDIEYCDEGSPQKQKGKRRCSTRNVKSNGDKGTSTTKVPTNSLATHQASPVPDLREEAKKIAEENLRLFAGKQLHPFFFTWKVGKKDQENTEVENIGGLDERKEKVADFGPIHVFEHVKDNLEAVDWSNWTFCDETLTKTSDHQEMACSIQSSLFPRKSDLSLLFKDISSGQSTGRYEDTLFIPSSFTPMVIDEEVTPHNILKTLQKDFEMDKLDIVAEDGGGLILGIEQLNAVLMERILSYYLNRGNHPENSLWTNKYQPEKASEVCGNNEAVKYINEWLRLWHGIDFHVTNRSSDFDKCLMREDDYDPYDCASDSENVNEASGLKNVLLVTGPVGSGKSAAIYACAKEQGFQVVEVNASDWRNGAMLKQKFGEAVGSHRLKRSQENPVGSQSKLNLMSSPAKFASGTVALDLNHEAVDDSALLEVGNSSDGPGLHGVSDGRVPCDPSEIKTLILFEDVDATLCEDRGFVSTIQQLADTGKRPMILTSNSENPVLPDNLDREEVCFTMPSLKELIHHTYLICVAEKVNLEPHLIERCIQLCGGDIRKSLMHLQFWCQSRRCLEDGKVQGMIYPLTFNLDAGHFTLPKLIPWELRSSLSEFIEAEISKSLCRMMEENHNLLKMVEEEVENTSEQNKLGSFKDEKASIDAKKEEIIKGNCFLHVDNDYMAFSNLCEFSNSSGSPIAFNRRNPRRKLGAVLSDSEDDIYNHDNPGVANGLCDDANCSEVPADDSNFPIPYSAVVETSCDPSYSSGAINLEIVKKSTETTIDNQNKFQAEGDLCDRTIDLLPLVDVNHSTSVAAEGSSDLTSDKLRHSGEEKRETNSQSPVIGYAQHCSTKVDCENTLTNKEVNAIEIQLENVNHCTQATTDHCLNQLGEQLEHRIETKLSVKRCLFSQAPYADPSCSAGDSTFKQSTDQLILSGKPSAEELQQQYLEMNIVNLGNQEAIKDFRNPLFDQLVCHQIVNKENVDLQHLETAVLVPFSHPTISKSSNPSSEFHFIEPEGKEVKHHHREARNSSDTSCAATGDSLNQLHDHVIGMAKQEIQNQYLGSAEANLKSVSPVGNSSKQMTGQLCYEDRNEESVGHQSHGTADGDTVSCPAVGNYMSPSNSKVLQRRETNAEEHQCEHSEATYRNHDIYHCQSIDISCVPESTFVPETEVDDGKQLPLGTDMTEFVSPVAADTVDSCFIRQKASEYTQCGINIDLNDRDEMWDSQSEDEHIEASTSGCQVMDECSRMDFLKRSKISRGSRLAAKNPVQERWNELRKTDIRHHSILENENALEVVELANVISNLISEADLLFCNNKLVTIDSLDQESEPDEENIFGWHDQQVQMASATAHHGFCLFAKDIDNLQLKMGVDNKVHLAWEILASTNNSMALGKLLRNRSSLTGHSLKVEAPTVDISSCRERESFLRSIVMSTAPLRYHLSLERYAFHDYLSSLAQISRLEVSRLAEGAEKTKRRRMRIAKNYLSSGGLDLSLEDISMLKECFSFR